MQKPYDTLHSATVDLNDATPMMRQFLEVKVNYPGVIMFYRMGDFYETFLEDALIAAKVLEITLTGRDAGKLGRVPMAGIPVKAVDTYLSKLLLKNFKVAICEQVEDPATAKGLVERKVVRVLSSGTITEQTLLKPEENNFLAAIVVDKAILGATAGVNPNQEEPNCGLAYCDITTGEFLTAQLSYSQLLSELDRIRPVEILVMGRKKQGLPVAGLSELTPWVPAEINSQYRCSALPEMAFATRETASILQQLFSVHSLEGFGLSDIPAALQACGAIAHYLKETFIETLPTFDRIQRYQLSTAMAMTTNTRRNLELLATVKNGQYEGSLIWVLNQTATSMGARLLRQWISQPLTHLPEIQSRLDGVEELVMNPAIRETVRQILPDIYDIERLSSKVSNLTVQPRDLIALKQSISRLPELSTVLQPLKSFYLTRLQEFPSELFKLVALIEQAIDDSPNANLKEGGIIKTGYHPELDQLRAVLANHDEWLANYEKEEREKTGIKTLKLGFNSAFGFFIEMSRAQASSAPAEYRRKQTLTNAERFTTETLKAYEAKVLDAQGRQYDLEFQLFMELRERLVEFAPQLKDCAHRVACLDVIQSLAFVAVEQGYVKPIVETSKVLNIQQGRHPVVEKMVPMGRFVPNHCILSSEEREVQVPQVMIITGPNMAGKSTYMRQNALIVLMAQIGSFVPASYARIGLVDAIYTRVGAVDDLSSGQSTFMVEMNETAQILNGATRNSLVLLDEVGRGTSTYDGVSIAWSVSEYLVNKVGCRTMFATHYHELNILEKTHPKVQNYRVCVSERDGEIEFLHTVEPGSAQKSYGIQVARMAGIPRDVVLRAENLLNALQKKEMATIDLKNQVRQLLDSDETPQLSLF